MYYLNREVYWLGANPDGEFASRKLGINRFLFLSDAAFAQRWAGTATVFLCIDEAELEKLRRHAALPSAQTEPIARFGTTLLLANHPVAH